jgi:hypothetical protein
MTPQYSHEQLCGMVGEEGTLTERISSFLGVVEVDSGTLLIGDPGYMLPHAASRSPGIDYGEVVSAPDTWPAQHLADKPVLLLQRFGGDGTFPVYGEFEGNHLVAVLIDFQPAEEADMQEA